MNETYFDTQGTSPADVGFEQFAEPQTRHEFSAQYQDRRRALIQEVARQPGTRNARTASKAATRITWRAAAAVAAVCVALPAAAWAITSHADFFAGALGTDGVKASLPSKATSTTTVRSRRRR